MKFTFEIIIELPINVCIKKFDATENMKRWQRGLISVEHVSGIPGQLGAKIKMHFKLGARDITALETITHRNLPHETHATYTSKGMHTIHENYFEATAENHTKWTNTSEFIPLDFTTRAMLSLMPKTYKKHTLQYMKDFKNFAEKGISVADA